MIQHSPFAPPNQRDRRVTVCRVHRVVSFAGGWTFNDLLRYVVYLGEREDKPAREVVRPVPNACPET